MERVNTLAPARVEWQSVTAVNGKPVPQITQMKGQQMTLNFAGPNQLQSLASTGGVEVTRRVGEAPEETTASHELTAKFDSGEWSTIDQAGDVHFRDGQRSGQSQRAHLDRTTDTVTLEGSVVFADGATRTTAQSASFVHSANIVRADGRVLTTELRQSAGGLSNFAQEPAHVSADHLVADTARGRAVYSGKGRLWQGDSVIEAETIELDNPSHTLVAKGHVLGVFPQAAWNPRPAQTPGGPPFKAQGKPFAPQGKPFEAQDKPVQPASVSTQLVGQTSSRPAGRTSSRSGRPETHLGRARGDLLTYWQSQSRARIEQGARVDTEQGSIQADKIDLFFSDSGAANATKQLSRAVATGDVDVRQEDRRGTSDKAEYTASEGKFVLSEGKPTVYSSTGDSTTGRQLTFYFADDRIVVESAEGSKTVTLHQVEKGRGRRKLQAVELSKSYRGRKVVDDLDLEISQGEVVGLLGPNGAGKTTTFYILVGLARPDSGRVLLNGDDITDLPMYLRARSGISYLPQEPSVFRQLTVEENLIAVLETLSLTTEQQRDRLEELLAQMKLETVRYNGAYTLSGGERRRLEIARSLVLEPAFILLDEPFSGIDPLTVVDIQKIISDLSREGIGVLVTDHQVRETLSVTDRAYIVQNGKVLAAGTPVDLSGNSDVRRVYLGEHFRLN